MKLLQRRNQWTGVTLLGVGAMCASIAIGCGGSYSGPAYLPPQGAGGEVYAAQPPPPPPVVYAQPAPVYAQPEAPVAVEAAPVAAADDQQPNIDMDAVHRAYWAMGGATYSDALQSFEQEVNKYYYADDYVSVAAERVDVDGYPMTVVTGYVDRDGAEGYNPDGDNMVFKFVQTGRLDGYNVNYEYLDAWGNVYYRGVHLIPQSPFYMSYYYNWQTPIGVYYTSYARIAYLRSWRVGWRASPVYLGWRRGFVGYRSAYVGRVATLRGTYGVSRASARLRVGVGVRGGVRANVNVRGNVRTNVNVHVNARATGHPGGRAAGHVAPHAGAAHPGARATTPPAHRAAAAHTAPVHRAPAARTPPAAAQRPVARPVAPPPRPVAKPAAPVRRSR